MRIFFIPRYDHSAASSRIRVFALAAEIQRQGLAEVEVITPGATPGMGTPPDMMVVQKRGFGGIHVNGGPPLIYDYDDNLPELIEPAARCCKAFAVDTMLRAQSVVENLKGNPAPNPIKIAIIPDCIDYAPVAPLHASPQMIGPCWFGNYGNYNCQWMAEAVKIMNPLMPTGIISDREWPITGSTAIWQRWSYESFPAAIRSFGVAMLSHKGQDRAKSNNKLIAAVTLGVPCIVGVGSPSYEELLRECDLAQFIVRTEADVRDCMRELSTVAGRQDYLDKIQGVVWRRYRVSAIAKQAMEIYRGVLNG